MLLKLPKDKDGKTGLFDVPVNEILYIESVSHEDRVIFNAENGQFFAPGTLRFWSNALTASGCMFEMVDRNNLVHLPKIDSIDPKLRRAYFTGGQSCTVSIGSMASIKRYLTTI